MNVLLISPATPATFWSFEYVMRFVSRKAAFPPLGLLTVAALLPRNWNLKLVDLNVTRLSDRDLDWADYVLISAMLVHADSVRQIVARCNARGRTVVAGGPLFTTGHDLFPEIRHFVLGEAEDIMPELVADMAAGRVKPLYRESAKPDVTRTPVPRWDLINPRHYNTMSVQFSRGCPFNCEFCDVIVLNGRVPRVKSPQQMIEEIEALLAVGWRDSIFIVDDNFIGNKVRAKELLRELIDWRRRTGRRTAFLTEASLNLADDPELLELMVRAGFNKVFVGIETPELDSLIECSKVQNTRRDMLASIRRIQNSGIEVMAGFIVGFDEDKPNIFERQFQFIQESGIATAMVGLLTALPGTRLFARLKHEGRLLYQSSGNNLDGVLNFIPKLDREWLTGGYKALVNRIYSPNVYYRRILTFLNEYRPSPHQPFTLPSRHDLQAFLKSLWIMGVWNRGRREYWKFFAKALLFHRRKFAEAMTLAIYGYHFRRVAAQL